MTIPQNPFTRAEGEEPYQDHDTDDEMMFDVPAEDLKPLPKFSEKWKKPFEGLLYLGQLEKTLDGIPYHKFMIRTLLPGEKIAIALLCKELEGGEGFGWGKAYRCACVAAALQQVDGYSLQPTDKGLSPLRQKYEYVINCWYDPVIDYIYNELNLLERDALLVLAEMGIIDIAKTEPLVKKPENGDGEDAKE